MPKNTQVSGSITTVAQSAAVTATPSSAGTLFPYTAETTAVTVVNTGALQDSDVAYQLNSAGWLKLGRNEGVTLPANLAVDKLYFRRIGSNNGAVECTMDGVVALTPGPAILAAPSASLSILARRDVRPFFETSAGTYVMTGASLGNFAKQLYKFTGDIVTGAGTNTSFFAFNLDASGVTTQSVYTNDGSTVIGGAGALIQHVWKLRTGNCLVMAIGHHATAGYAHRYLLRFNPTTDKAGTDYTTGGTYGNRQVSLHIGSLNGTVTGSGTAGIHALHQRSLCEARVGTDNVILFAEYNVAGAGNGTPRTSGGLNDQAIVWRSTNDGVSFTKLLEFNTDGTHRFDHFHSVIQDPYTRIIYFLTGDGDDENAIIGWDGKSAPPIANATHAQIAATPGWTISYGDELRRFGDLIFTPEGRIYGLPDSDTNPELSTKLINAYSSCAIDPALRYVTQGKVIPRTGNIPPLIALRHSSGAMIYGSLRTASAPLNDAITGDRYHHFWTSMNGMDWALAAKVYNYQYTAIGNVLDLWEDTAGNIIAGTTFGRGGSWGADNRTASCVIFRPSLQYGAPTLTTDV